MIAPYAGAKHVPFPDASVIASGALLILAGSLVALGVKPKIGAAAIITFLATVSPAIHNFWAAEDPQEGAQEVFHFTKNMALLASALALMGVEEPWPLSVSLERPGRFERIVNTARRKLAA